MGDQKGAVDATKLHNIIQSSNRAKTNSVTALCFMVEPTTRFYTISNKYLLLSKFFVVLNPTNPFGEVNSAS